MRNIEGKLLIQKKTTPGKKQAKNLEKKKK
jgi:hypothetical protein